MIEKAMRDVHFSAHPTRSAKQQVGNRRVQFTTSVPVIESVRVQAVHYCQKAVYCILLCSRFGVLSLHGRIFLLADV